jgi:branched-chain amino acid transport system permease protein
MTMSNQTRPDFSIAIKYGFLAGVVSLSVSAIGLVGLLAQRELITGVITLGQVILFLAPVALSYLAAGKAPSDQKGLALLFGLITGFISALPLIALVFLAVNFDLRQFMPNVSPALIELLTFGQGTALGSLILLAVSSLLGLAAAGMFLLPDRIRHPIFTGLLWTFVIGMFSEILSDRIRSFFGVPASRFVFRAEALRPAVALVLFIAIIALSAFWQQRGERVKERFATRTAGRESSVRWVSIAFLIVIMLILPFLLGTYLSEVVNNVLIFALMGFGLNIVVGFAGLLDLGYVAFFAIGAYTMAILTTEGDLGITGLSFWLAIPICVLVAVFAGIMLGIPVLRMRGDYLAIVTLGFGEIIRILALSDLLKPYIGGAQGVLKIPKPGVVGLELIRPDQFYYVALIGVIIAAFVSWRLSGARLGRQWMAMREDEDVAEAMGIRLVNTKLLAFAIGAAFSGLAGAIFASKLTSIFPHSFNLLISINVLCLIIIGGLGSLPGVVVGALFLVGLPELLREFAEYRLLMYGIILIVMMLAKPEGLLPSAVRKREFHVDEDMDYGEFAETAPPRAETREPLTGPPHL